MKPGKMSKTNDHPPRKDSGKTVTRGKGLNQLKEKGKKYAKIMKGELCQNYAKIMIGDLYTPGRLDKDILTISRMCKEREKSCTKEEGEYTPQEKQAQNIVGVYNTLNYQGASMEKETGPGLGEVRCTQNQEILRRS